MNSSRLAMSVVLALAVSGPAYAQTATAPEEEAVAITSGGFEDIVVTARKKARAEALQSVPLTISAISGARIEDAQIKNLAQMTGSIPNASLDEVGAAKGTAAFTIRGVSMGSTLPTLESPVGVFIDGMYMPSVLGVITDFFDVDGVEVLRGPQGTLFGKNVTAGAVLVRSRRPSDKFEGFAQASVETGLEYKIGGAISGPLTDTLKVRLAGYYNHDNGWFKNDFDGADYGRGTTWLIRPTIEWDPTPDINVIVRYEHGKSTTKGLPLQNYAFNDRHTFNFAQDHAGGTRLQWDQITAEVNWQVGAGTITTVTGYRDNKIKTDYDTAGTPIQDYQINYTNPTKSFSHEGRYAIRLFDSLDLTAGIYYFESDIELLETRRLRTVANFAPRSYGARQKAKTYAAFVQGDWDVTDKLQVTAGLRYTYDKKHADVGLFTAAADTCDPLTGQCVYAFPNLRGKWDSWSPKIGIKYEIAEAAQVYASWSRGYRAGGFTSRQTAPAQALRWDQEATTAYELGFKGDLFNRRMRVNLAGFINKVDDMIRVTTTPGAAGVVNDTRNIGDATIKGVEFEGQFIVTDRLRLNGYFGYQKGQYDTIRFSPYDAPGEPVGTINQTDYNLKLVRLSPWTYGMGAQYNLPIGSMTLRNRVDFAFRDASYTTDDNLSRQNSFQSLDASIALDVNERLTLTAYGRNLTNHAFSGLVVLIPNALLPPVPPGRRGNVGWLSEGRVIGAEARIKF